ncbi:MAG: bifunctional glutamate N-acetyltransferase/amino-acid acetyltransferase ArgJ [Candidatus Desulfofervidaceae bacterium]|nr:bifunctional glutamate N-acetyltransferase/amino-acid acetyltransferase ArgJ [Candidatus Desulfofervidaceae bacterium]
MESVFSVSGFRVGTASAGIKNQKCKDMVLIYSEKPAVVAGTFTQNQVQAAPVKLTSHRIKSGLAQAIVINSGNANACTGEQGERDAKEMTALVAKGLGIPEQLVLVCSTGVIGQPLPMKKIKTGIEELLTSLHPIGWEDAAEAIMTTDTFPKLIYKKGEIEGIPFSLLGIAKGAGMIMPNMATMLAFFVTDIAITPPLLQPMFGEIVSQTFNRISVDGDTSTNDTALILANGYAKNPIESEKEFRPFREVLFESAAELAKMIAQDGEGASKLIQIEIKGAKSVKEAEIIAATIANSPLVKTAIYGEDANWGRIIAAIGRSGVKINPDKIDIYFGDICLVKNGLGQGEKAENLAHEYLRNKEVLLKVDLHSGTEQITWYTCDLTEEYIKINAEYRT